MKKNIIIFVLFILIGCSNKYYTNYANYSDVYFIGRGSALKLNNIDKSNKEARLHALNDLILQIKSEISSKNSLDNNTYFENTEIKSNAIIKKWRETKLWEKDGYIWSEVILNKNDYYESINEYIKEEKDKIYYNVDMAKCGLLRNRLEFYIKALELSINFDNNIFIDVKNKTQNLIDSIKIIPEFKCHYNKIECINANIFINNIHDSSLYMEWFIKNNRFNGSLSLDTLKIKLLKYGIVFSTIIVNKLEENKVEINNGNIESYVTPRIRIDTLYSMDNNGIIVSPIQIADTLSLRNSKFFVRKNYNNEYCLFDGIRQSNSKLSMFILPENTKPLDFIKIKFYKNMNCNLNDDIQEVYFDDNYIYVDNLARIYYIDSIGEWKYIDMVKNSLSQLTVISEPIGAQVFINNRYVGLTPYYLSSPMEPYAIISIRMNGFYISEYFTSLLDGNSITKKFILKRMPKLKYGTYIEPNSYYAEDNNSINNLKNMIDIISNRISLLENQYKYMNDEKYELYNINKYLNEYRDKLNNRIYCQYFSIDKKIKLSRVNKIKDTIGNLAIEGNFDIPIYEFENINLNIDQCFLKLEYKKERGEYYRYVGLSLLYHTSEYRFNGKYLFK